MNVDQERKAIADSVRHMMNRRELTVKNIVQTTGISSTYYHNLVSCSDMVSLDHMLRVFKVLGIQMILKPIKRS